MNEFLKDNKDELNLETPTGQYKKDQWLRSYMGWSSEGEITYEML
jgi:hypothetical protein